MTAVAIHLSYSTLKRVLVYVGGALFECHMTKWRAGILYRPDL